MPEPYEWPVQLFLDPDGIDFERADMLFGFDRVIDRCLVISHECLSGHPHGFGLVDAVKVLGDPEGGAS